MLYKFTNHSIEQNNQQVIEIDDTVDSGDNITSYCVCERQAGSSDDLDDFNTVQCNLTESTQYCSGSSQSTEESSGTIYTLCSGSNRKKRSVSSSHTTESSNPSDSDDVVEFSVKLHWTVLKSSRSSELPACRSHTQ
jgi:hypothetical protein